MMLTFWMAAAGLLCLAIGLLVTPLLRAKNRPTTHQSGNLAVLQDHFRQLNEELATGKLNVEQHALAVADLERRVLEEESSASAQGAPSRQGGSSRKTVWALGLLMPILSLGLYARLGNPAALTPQTAAAPAAGEVTLEKLNELVGKLAERMNAEPNNLEGWTQLARAYAMLQQFEKARQAYEHAIAISPPDAQLLADLADVIAMQQGQSVLGEPEQLIQRALEINPQHVKALALAGSVAFEKSDAARAVELWSQALRLAPPESELAKALEGSISLARSQTGTPPSGEVASNGKLSGIVKLAPELAQRAAPDDKVFIFARASEGPRMPLAVVQARVKDLPLSFTLDDTSAMSPQSRLSQFKTVIVSARVSKSGTANPQPGDLTGHSAPVSHVVQNLELVIDRTEP